MSIKCDYTSLFVLGISLTRVVEKFKAQEFSQETFELFVSSSMVSLEAFSILADEKVKRKLTILKKIKELSFGVLDLMTRIEKEGYGKFVATIDDIDFVRNVMLFWFEANEKYDDWFTDELVVEASASIEKILADSQKEQMGKGLFPMRSTIKVAP